MEKNLQPKFVETANWGDFLDAMISLHQNAGVGRLACVSGPAGYGKTEAVIHFHAGNTGREKIDSIYLRALMVWTPRAFLNDLCRKLGRRDNHSTAAAAHHDAVDALTESPRIVFIDEIEKLRYEFMETVRDLADAAGAAVVLVGEETLRGYMKSAGRVRSRTLESVEFQPMSGEDLYTLARDGAGATLSEETMAVFLTAAKGEFRSAARDLKVALRIAAARKSSTITPEIAKAACKAGLRN